MSEWVDLLDSLNQKFVGPNMASSNAQDGIIEAYNAAKLLKGYGEVAQSTATASAGETLAIENGNTLVSNLTGSYALTNLTTTYTNTSATWVLKHNGQTVAFPASFVFPEDTQPTALTGNAILLGMFTVNAGVTWIVNYVKNYTLP